MKMLVLRTNMSPKRLGMTIQRWRTKRKLTQAELARRAGIHRIYLAQIEGQTKVPSLATLERLAKALRVKVSALVD